MKNLLIATSLLMSSLTSTSASANVMTADWMDHAQTERYTINYSVDFDAQRDNTFSFYYNPTMDNQITGISDTMYDFFSDEYNCDIYCRISSDFHFYEYEFFPGEAIYNSNRQHFYNIGYQGEQVHDQLIYFLHNLASPYGHDTAASDNPANRNLTFDIDWLNNINIDEFDNAFYTLDIYAHEGNSSRYWHKERLAMTDFEISHEFVNGSVDVPEPTTLWVFGLGIFGLALSRKF